MTELPAAIDVGSARIWLLNDGRIPGPNGPDGMPSSIEVNAFLVRSMDRLILVDCGFGDKWAAEEPDLRRANGSVLDGLRRNGFEPEEIDVVVNTHLHVDHAGGDTRFETAGALVATFPRADYLIQTAEWAFAGAPSAAWSHLFRRPDFWPLWDLGHLRLVDGPHRITEEVLCVPAPGHTPGHQAVRVESGGFAALLAGDALPNDGSVRSPRDRSDLDVEPGTAAGTREALIGWAVEHGAWLGLAHAGITLRRVDDILATAGEGAGAKAVAGAWDRVGPRGDD